MKKIIIISILKLISPFMPMEISVLIELVVFIMENSILITIVFYKTLDTYHEIKKYFKNTF